MKLETTIRRTILFCVGVFGILYEVTRSGDARTTLLVTDLILIGLVPAEILIQRHFKSGGDKDKSSPNQTED